MKKDYKHPLAKCIALNTKDAITISFPFLDILEDEDGDDAYASAKDKTGFWE